MVLKIDRQGGWHKGYTDETPRERENWQYTVRKNGAPTVPHGGPSRRHATANHDHDYTAEEVEFMQAMDAWKRRRRRPHPDCRDVLAVLKSLGYARVA